LVQQTLTSTHAHTSEVVAVVFRKPIFKKDQRIDLAIFAVNATTTSNSTTVLRKSIMPLEAHLQNGKCCLFYALNLQSHTRSQNFEGIQLFPSFSA
jgi:hypothetical protein